MQARQRQTFRYSFHLSIPFSGRSLLAKGASYAAMMQEYEMGHRTHSPSSRGFDFDAVVWDCEGCEERWIDCQCEGGRRRHRSVCKKTGSCISKVIHPLIRLP